MSCANWPALATPTRPAGNSLPSRASLKVSRGSMQRPRVLITGFGPFPGVPENPSGWLAEALTERWLSAEPHRHIRARILPTEWEATALMPRLCETLQPDVMLHFGVCAQAKGFRIEHSAHNRVAARADARGAF